MRGRAKKVRQRRGGGRFAVLGVVLAFAVGVGVALVVRPLPAPGWADTGSQSGSVEAAPQLFDDERSVPAEVVTVPEWKALSPVSGVLRASTCKVGTAVKSGESPFLVDDQRVIALHLSSPPWRDLEYGAKGDDVLALQEELVRLGYLDVEPDGSFGGATKAAVSQMWETAGGNKKQVTVPLSQLLWLPAESVTPMLCEASVGTVLSPGSPLFTAGGGVASLKLRLPDALVAGERSLVLGDVSTALPKDGVVTDAKFLSALVKTPRYQSWAKEASGDLSVTVRLDEPLKVWAVPASALYDISGGEACVISVGAPMAVRIVGSQLGSTMVLADASPGAVEAFPAEGSASCR